jgi:tRNA pseudouridine55 synthase
MDGLLLVDKPAGPTSHDVVARVRIALGERRIGHTGTLDPPATGLLPLVVGRATRLARFLSAGDKSYDAAIRLGISTCTGDAEGDPIAPPYTGSLPAREVVEQALGVFRGTFAQQPPAFSAKRIGGRRSYDLARRSRSNGAPAPVQPSAAMVTAHRLDLVSYDDDTVGLRIECSAGFYVRSLADDLGRSLGTGAHLIALRRTRTGSFYVSRAIPLAGVEGDPARAAASIIPMSSMLPGWASVTLNAGGVRRAITGCELGPADIQAASEPELQVATGAALVRLVDTAGELVGVGEPSVTGSLLHPSVVLR